MLRSFVAISFLVSASGVAAQEADESALDAFDKTRVAAAQPIREPAGAAELRAAIRRISYNSNDADALADAGNASLILGDANAALNFLTRANVSRPNNGRTVAALASATVRTENPFEALRLFDDAVRLGISDRTIAADRGLAYDLLGNFARAQQDYNLARTAASSNDLIIRQAISLSLAGQKNDADAMLVTLLQQNNAAAWRARAFMLAARGEFRESTKVTQGFMDAGSAQRMERYLRLMPDLTAAQQAAAIHLGHFPASQYVGRDSDQLRRVASAIPPAAPSPGESRLIPSGAPLGPKPAKKLSVRVGKKLGRVDDRKPSEIAVETVAVAATSPVQPLDKQILPARIDAVPKNIETQAARAYSAGTGRPPLPQADTAPVKKAVPGKPEIAALGQLAPAKSVLVVTPYPANNVVISNSPAIAAGATPTPVSLAASSISVPTVTAEGAPQISATTTVILASATPAPPSTPASTSTLQGPTPNGTPITSTTATSAVMEPVIATPVSQPAVSPAFDLAAIVSAIEIPESEQKPSAVPVDLKKIKPAAPKIAAADVAAKTGKLDPKVAAKGKAESAQPARFWVQIATGEASALSYDYRKWSKKSAELFKGQSGWTSAWGKTSRLLVGPFVDMKGAKKWETDFKKSGGDGFMWKSENGVVVTALKSK